MTQPHEILRDVPVATLGIIGTCTFLYMLQHSFNLDLRKVTLCPRRVLYLHEYYRIISSCLFHTRLMHLGMNMVSTTFVSSKLEKRFGTLRHIVTTLWSILLTSCAYILVAAFLSLGLGFDNLMYKHSVGFSGVIFHMSTLECSLAPNRSRSVFGIFFVPSYMYPGVLLVGLQMVMPDISFTGHLAGIFVGTLQIFGFLDPISVGDDHLRKMERWASLQWLTSRSSFCPMPAVSQTGGQRDPAALRQMVLQSCRTVIAFWSNVFEIIQIVVFGRGRDVNSDIQLAAGDSPSSHTDRERQVAADREMEQQRQMQEDERVRQEEEEVKQIIATAMSLVKPAPEAGGTTVRFVLPSGMKLNRRFASSETMAALRAFLRLQFHERNIDMGRDIGLSTSFPRKSYNEHDDQTLEELGLSPQVVLMVQDLDAK
jgi:membrane associated rhomboid family serine protease